MFPVVVQCQPAKVNAPRFHQKSWRPTLSPRPTGWSQNGWQWTPLERSVLDSRKNSDSVPNPSPDWVMLWHGALWGCFSATTRANVAYLSQRGKQEGAQSQSQCGGWLFQAVLLIFLVFIKFCFYICIYTITLSLYLPTYGDLTMEPFFLLCWDPCFFQSVQVSLFLTPARIWVHRSTSGMHSRVHARSAEWRNVTLTWRGLSLQIWQSLWQVARLQCMIIQNNCRYTSSCSLPTV